MDFISVKEASSKWGISERRVRALCESGRIEGATRCGNWVWSIPAGTQRPADGRTLRYIKNRNLKTGAQSFSKINSVKPHSTELNDFEKAGIINDSLAFDSINLTSEQTDKVFTLQGADIPLETQILILNMKSCLENPKIDINEKTLKDINKRLLLSIDEKKAAQYKLNGTQSQETEAVFSQYSGSWSVLHPLARAAFLFVEIMRIQPFEKANTQTAFTVLAYELLKAKLPPVVFGKENIDELKASLASANMRGNTQPLLSMILSRLTEEE